MVMEVENKKYLCALSESVIEEGDEVLLVRKGVGRREVAVQVVPDAADGAQGEPVPGGAEAPEAGDGGVEQEAHEVGGSEVDGGGGGAAVVPEKALVAGVESGHEDVDIVVAGEGVVVGGEGGREEEQEGRRGRMGRRSSSSISSREVKVKVKVGSESVEVSAGEGILLLEEIVERVQQAQLQSLPLVVYSSSLHIF
jgi:hypothetical protein